MLILGSSLAWSGKGTAGMATSSIAERRPWSAIHNWVYWLDGPRLDQIGASRFELAVIDYSSDGTARGAFSVAQIDSLRHSTCSRRVLAYLSIGQAEEYRWYWQRGWQPGVPAWIGHEDQDWAGNYWVQYWQAGWQSIVLRYVDKIIAAGFDGLYLDRIDAYMEPYARGHRADMIAFVGEIARYARSHSPLGRDFGIFAQNAEELAAQDRGYAEILTGLGREETYVQATNIPTSATDRAGTELSLQQFRRQSAIGLVLTVDYADSQPLISQAYKRAMSKGFVPYVTDVGLDRMRLNPGFLPECHAPTAKSAGKGPGA